MAEMRNGLCTGALRHHFHQGNYVVVGLLSTNGKRIDDSNYTRQVVNADLDHWKVKRRRVVNKQEIIFFVCRDITVGGFYIADTRGNTLFKGTLISPRGHEGWAGWHVAFAPGDLKISI